MPYFTLNKITPPAPNDPNVNEVTQLNDNWDNIDLKLSPYISGGAMSGVQQGQEHFDSNFDFCVNDGASTIRPDDIGEGWSAWTNLPMLSPRAIRPSFTPKWRNNSLLRMVELTGGVLFDAVASAWTMGTSFIVNADAAGSPPASMQPIGNLHISPAATGLTTGTAVVASALVRVEIPGGSTFVRIGAQYMGGPGGGNFVMLDQVWWWY